MTQQQEAEMLVLFIDQEIAKRNYQAANEKLDLFIRRHCKTSLIDIHFVEREIPTEKNVEEPQPTNGESKP